MANDPSGTAPQDQNKPQTAANPTSNPGASTQLPQAPPPVSSNPSPPIVGHPAGGIKPIAAKPGVALGPPKKGGPELHTPGVSKDQPRMIPVHAIEADPAPGETKPEQPGLYVNANYHAQEHVPLMQMVSFQERDVSGSMVNRHGLGVAMVRQRVVNPDAEGGENWHYADPFAVGPEPVEVATAPTLPGPQQPQPQTQPPAPPQSQSQPQSQPQRATPPPAPQQPKPADNPKK